MTYEEVIAFGEDEMRRLSPSSYARREREIRAFEAGTAINDAYIREQVEMMRARLAARAMRAPPEAIRFVAVGCIIAATLVVVGFIGTFVGYGKTLGLLVPVGLTALWGLGEAAAAASND